MKSVTYCVVMVICWLGAAMYLGGQLHFARMAQGHEQDPEIRKSLKQRALVLERLFYAANIVGSFGTAWTVRHRSRGRE